MVTEADAGVMRLSRAARRNRYLRGLLSTRGALGCGLVGGMLVAGLLAPWLSAYPPDAQSSVALLPPNAVHPLGTDDLGRDLLSRELHGIGIDVAIAAGSVPVAGAIGVALAVLGSLARPLETVVQRLFDLAFAFPTLVLALLVTMVAGPGVVAILVAVVLINVPVFGRLALATLRQQRHREYAVAARALGAGPLRVLCRHVLPNAIDPLIVQAALSLSAAVFVEGGLSFVGLGVALPEPSLGNLLGESLPFLIDAPLFAVAPMAAVTALVLGFNLVADGLGQSLARR
jgi:peptide/nickel transport system permease protein